MERIYIEGNQEDVMSIDEFSRHKTEVEGMVERRERLALRNKVESEKHLKAYGGIGEGIGRKTHLHNPINGLERKR